jgi:transcriptional regulator with XRE-family HTH domain
MTPEVFGKNLRAAREAKGFRQKQLGALVGISGQLISLIENGDRDPRLSVMRNLVEACGFTLAEFFNWTPPPEEPSAEPEATSALSRALDFAATKPKPAADTTSHVSHSQCHLSPKKAYPECFELWERSVSA